MKTEMNQVFVGVVSSLICAICFGMFKMHTDVEIMKSHMEMQDKVIMKQQEYSEKFDQMLQRFDKSLALQDATIQTLKLTVEANQKTVRR